MHNNDIIGFMFAFPDVSCCHAAARRAYQSDFHCRPHARNETERSGLPSMELGYWPNIMDAAPTPCFTLKWKRPSVMRAILMLNKPRWRIRQYRVRKDMKRLAHGSTNATAYTARTSKPCAGASLIPEQTVFLFHPHRQAFEARLTQAHALFEAGAFLQSSPELR